MPSYQLIHEPESPVSSESFCGREKNLNGLLASQEYYFSEAFNQFSTIGHSNLGISILLNMDHCFLHAARSHPYILPWGPWQSVKSHVTGETLLGHVLFSSPLAQETSHCNPTCHPGWSCPSLPAILAILASCHPGWSCPLIPVVSLWPWPVFL